jgi:hypothetical protein
MAKFIDKKERVFDLELTSYGKYLFAIGKFKPEYYAFFDDNVIYDGAYASIKESQNDIHTRIKEETPYLESLVLFEDIDNKLPEVPKVDESGKGIISIDTVPMGPQKPRFDNFRYDNSIGDSFFDGKKPDLVPSWKIVSLQGDITSTAQKETQTSITELNIPQINMSLNYKKKIVNREAIQEFTNTPVIGGATNIASFNGNFRSSTFIDNNLIELAMDDAMIYIDEVNTEILTENFDIEVFLLEEGEKKLSLRRKYFKNKKHQVIDGIMMSERPETNIDANATEDAVEYFFDILKDSDVDQVTACKIANVYNKQTYYISLDFDCNFEQQENFYNDIYGSEVIPEICLD